LVRRQSTCTSRSISLAADDRVQRAFLGQFGQVAAEAVQRRGLALAASCPRPPAPAAGPPPPAPTALPSPPSPGAEQVEHLLADLLELEAQVHQHLRGHAVVLAQQAEQQVLGAHVVVVEVAGLFDGVLDDLLGARRLRQLAHGDHLGAGLDQLLDLEADLAQVHIEVLQHVGADARAFLHQAEQDVLGPDVLVVEPLGFLVGQGHDLAGSVGETLKHAAIAAESAGRPKRISGRGGYGGNY
jgi:hypothetical protein